MDKLNRQLAYLALQVTREGQASYAHVHEIANGLRARGWTVSIFEPRARLGSSWGVLMLKILSFAATQIRLWRSGWTADVVYVRAHTAALPTSVWALVRGIPVIQEVNGPLADLLVCYPWTRAFSRLIEVAFWFTMRHASAIVCVTPELSAWLKPRVGSVPVYVIGNGANTGLFRPDAPTEYDISQPYAVFFGALSRWQGIDTLLRAIQDPRWPRELKLVIIGDGAEKEKVETEARVNPLLAYLGRQPYRSVPGIVARSIASLVPENNIEGRAATGLCPLKLFESLACGVPVVVTDFPGQADLVRDNECGIVIPPEDPAELAKAVRFLFENRDMATLMGRRGQDAVSSAHSWEHRARATEEAIVGVLMKRRAGPPARGDAEGRARNAGSAPVA